MTALKYNSSRCGSTLKYLPNILKDNEDSKEIYETAIKYYNGHGYILKYIPEKYITLEFCLKVVNNTNINKIPKQFKDHVKIKVYENNKDNKDILQKCYFNLVKKDIKNMSIVPDKFKTTELCLYALAKDYSYCKFIPDKIKTDYFYSSLVKNNENIITMLPDKIKTRDFYIDMVHNNINILNYIPDDMKTNEFYFDLAKTNVENILKYVSCIKNKGTATITTITEVCVDIIKYNLDNYLYLPTKLKTDEFHQSLLKWKPKLVFPYFDKNVRIKKNISQSFIDTLEYGEVCKYMDRISPECYTDDKCLQYIKTDKHAFMKYMPQLPINDKMKQFFIELVDSINDYKNNKNIIPWLSIS